MASEFTSLEIQNPSFQIVYTGSALNNNTLDIADFAPAILALERMLQEINLRVNDNNSEVGLGIVSIEQGSIVATFILRFKKASENIATLYHSDSPDDLNKLLSILKNGGGIIAATAGGIVTVGAGLFWVISQIYSTEPPTIEKRGNTVTIYESKNDYYYINISNDTYEMATNQVVIQEAAKVVQPLVLDGVDGFYVRSNSINNTENRIYQEYQITKDNLDAFPVKDLKKESQQQADIREIIEVIQENPGYLRPVKNLTEIKREAVYHKGPYAIIMVPNSNLEDAWQLKGEMKGGRKFSAHIRDQAFLNMIRDKSIILSEHDSIIARITQSFQGSRSKYEVTEVTDYIPGGIKTIARR